MSKFLAIAEEFGLIAEIDDLMVRRAVELAARGHRVNVNLSAQSVSKPGMCELLGAQISRLRARPPLLGVGLPEPRPPHTTAPAPRSVQPRPEVGRVGPLPRSAGASAGLVDGIAALYLARGGSSLQTLPAFDDPQVAGAALGCLGSLLADPSRRELLISRVDGEPVGRSPWYETLLRAGFLQG